MCGTIWLVDMAIISLVLDILTTNHFVLFITLLQTYCWWAHGALPHNLLVQVHTCTCTNIRCTLIHSHHAHSSEVKSTVLSTPPICWSPASNFKGLTFAESIANASPWCVWVRLYCIRQDTPYTCHLPRLHICIQPSNNLWQWLAVVLTFVSACTTGLTALDVHTIGITKTVPYTE